MSNKPRMVELTHDEALALGNSEDLDTPVVYYDEGKYYVDAAEWRAWRALQSQSAAEPK